MIECQPPADRQCSSCLKAWPISDFKWRSDESGWTKMCVKCRERTKKSQQTWRDLHPEEAYDRSKAAALQWRTRNPELHTKREKQAYVDRCQKPGYKEQMAEKSRRVYTRLKEGDPEKYEAYLVNKRAKRKALHAKRKAERGG